MRRVILWIKRLFRILVGAENPSPDQVSVWFSKYKQENKLPQSSDIIIILDPDGDSYDDVRINTNSNSLEWKIVIDQNS